MGSAFCFFVFLCCLLLALPTAPVFLFSRLCSVFLHLLCSASVVHVALVGSSGLLRLMRFQSVRSLLGQVAAGPHPCRVAGARRGRTRRRPLLGRLLQRLRSGRCLRRGVRRVGPAAPVGLARSRAALASSFGGTASGCRALGVLLGRFGQRLRWVVFFFALLCFFVLSVQMTCVLWGALLRLWLSSSSAPLRCLHLVFLPDFYFH